MKGYLYTIEVMIAVAIIVISITYLFRFPVNAASSDDALMKQYGLNAIALLDSQDMRYLAYNNLTGLNRRINALLPDALNATTCLDCNLNVDAESVIVLNHYMAGDKSYEPKTLRLFIWRKQT